MNKWRVVGHIFLVWGSVLLISALGAFISMISVIDQTPHLDQALISAVIAPYLGLAAFAYVISGVGYYAGRENAATPTSSNESNVTMNTTLDKTDNLEENVDNNFNFTVIIKRFEEIEEKQKKASGKQ